jgi:hypothetical protein
VLLLKFNLRVLSAIYYVRMNYDIVSEFLI